MGMGFSSSFLEREIQGESEWEMARGQATCLVGIDEISNSNEPGRDSSWDGRESYES